MSDKQLLLTRTALTLFIKKGIHAVGINEILLNANVAKKTLYNHFSSKEVLIVSALRYRDKIFMHWLNQTMKQESSAQASVLSIFKALDLWFNNKADELGDFNGCFFINAAAEYKEAGSVINNCCKQHKRNVWELVHHFVVQFVHNTQHANELTDYICLLKEGAITTALVQGDLQAAKKTLPMAKKIINLYQSV